MVAVLHHVGSDRGQLGDLVANRLEVDTPQRAAATAAGRRLAINDRLQPLGRDELAGMPLVAMLPAPRLSGRRPGRAAFDMDRVAGGGLGGVRRVLPQLSLQGADLLLEGSDQRQHCPLDVRRRLVPKFSGDGRLGVHDTDITARLGQSQGLTL
jgi:hypothetical protein